MTPTSKSRSSTWTKDESIENTPYTANSILFNVPEDLTSKLFLDPGSEERSRAQSDSTFPVNTNDTPQSSSPKRRGSGLTSNTTAEYDFSNFLEITRNSPATPASDIPSPSSPIADRKRDKDKDRRVSKAKSFSTLPIPPPEKQESAEITPVPSGQGNVGQATAPLTNAGSPVPQFSEFLSAEDSFSAYSHSPTDQKIKPRNVYIKYQFMLTQLLVDPQFDIATNLLLESISRGNDSDLISCIVNYFEKIGRITHFIKIAISQDIQQTTSANNLFRGESLAAKLVSNFFRKTGLKYLQQCVVDPAIGEITHMSSSQVSSDQVQDQLLESLLIRLVSTVDKCPVSIRQICQFTQSEISTKFGEEWYIVAKSLVFLRFICPSLVSPQSYSNSATLSASNTNANEVVNTLVKLSKRVQQVVNNMDIAETHFSILTRAFISKLMAPVNEPKSNSVFSDHMRCLLLDDMVSAYQLSNTNFEVSDQLAEDCLQYIIFCLKEYLPNLKSRLLSLPTVANAVQGNSGQQSPRAQTRSEKQAKKEKTALFSKLQEVLLGLSVSYQAHKQNRLSTSSSRSSGLFGKGQSKSTQKQDIVVVLETEREAKQYYHSLLMDLMDKMVASEESRLVSSKKKDGKKHRRSRSMSSEVNNSSTELAKRDSLDDIRRQYNDVMTQLNELRQFKELKEHYSDIVKLVQELTQYIQASNLRESPEVPPVTQIQSPKLSLTPTQPAANSNLASKTSTLAFSNGSSPSRRPSLTDEDITRSYENYKDLLEAQTIDLKDQFEEIIRLDDPSDSRGSMLSTRYWMEYAKEKEIQLKLSKRNTYKILLNTIKIEKDNRRMQHELNAANAKIEELTKALNAANNKYETSSNQSKSAPHTVRLNNNINIHFTSSLAPEKESLPTTTTEAEVGAERTNKTLKVKAGPSFQDQKLNRAANNSTDNVAAHVTAVVNPPPVKEPLSGPATLDVDKVTQALLAWQQRPSPRKFATFTDSSDTTDSETDDDEQPQVNSRINLSQRPVNLGQRRSSVTFGAATIIQTQVVSKETPSQPRTHDNTQQVEDDELTQEDEDMKSRQFNVLEIVNDTDNEAEDTAPEDGLTNNNTSKTKVVSSSSNEFLKLLDEEDYKQIKKNDHTNQLAKVPSAPNMSAIPKDSEHRVAVEKKEEAPKQHFTGLKTVPVRPSSMTSLNYKPAQDEEDAQQLPSSAPTSPSAHEKTKRTKSMKVKKGNCAVQ